MIDPSRKPGTARRTGAHGKRWAAAAAVLAALLAAAVLVPRLSRSPGEAAGWALVAGVLAPDAGGPATRVGERIPAGTFTAAREARLATGGESMTLAARSRIRIAVDGSLEAVLAGKAVVEGGERLRIGLVDVVLLEHSMIVIDPEGFFVARGRIEVGGSVLGPGSRFAPGPPLAEREAPPEEPPVSVDDLPPPAGTAGRVIDATTGLPLAGAEVRATFFHGPPIVQVGVENAGAERRGIEEALGIDGAAVLPPLHVEGTVTGADGTFELGAFRPEDPRIAVHIQVIRRGYGPETALLSGRPGLDGRWGDVEVRLRRAATGRVEIVDPEGAPLAGAPVRVAAWREGHDFEGAERVLLAGFPLQPGGGRLLTLEPWRLLFTDDDGGLSLSLAAPAYDLELLHPERYLRLPRRAGPGDGDGEVEMLGRVTCVLPLEGALRIAAPGSWVENHVLLDQNGFVVPGAEIEVALQGMPPLRARSDDAGWFRVGIWPFPEPGPKLGYAAPREGEIIVHSPELYRRGARVVFPSLVEEVVANGRPAGRVLFRAVADGPDGPEPIAPEGVETSLDGHLVHRGADGRVEVRAVLPLPGTPIDIFIAGFLPARAYAFASDRVAGEMDLGDVAFAPGWTREVVIEGVEGDELRGARVLVTPEGYWPRREARHDAGSGRAVVPGLARGMYSFSVEGPRIQTVSAAVSIRESDLAEPLVIPVALLGDEEAVVRGRVVEITPIEALQSSVVERWFLAGAAEPLAFPPYALGPDGTFGSVRRLLGPVAVEVSIIGPADLAAGGVIPRAGPPVFDAGDVRLGPRTHAEVIFEAKGLGRVAPPLRVSLIGEGGGEQLARLRIRGRKLFADNLIPGKYTLRWRGDGDAEESHSFHVPRGGPLRVSTTAVRSPLDEEAIEVLVADRDGRPIDGAEIRPPARDHRFEPEERGILLAPVTPRRTTVFEVRAPGFLPAHVEVAAGAVVPTKIELHRGAAARALLLDPNGDRVDGEVSISWAPLTASPIRHGEPGTVLVSRGGFEAADLPPLPLVFTLRIEPGGPVVRGEWTLPEGPRPFDVGVLRFEETRKLEGSVYLPDGTPAPGASVAIVPRGAARRFPLGKDPLEAARWSVKTSAQGIFAFDGLPVDLPDDLALVARFHGLGDAIEDPIDLGLASHDLLLPLEARLEVDAGYRDRIARGIRVPAEGEEGTGLGAFGFWLEYVPGDLGEDGGLRAGEAIPLGEIGPAPGARAFDAVYPGRYRLRWGLRRGYEPFPGIWQDALVLPGRAGRLAVRLEGRTLGGRATLNGAPVERGWVLLTAAPGADGGTHVGRIVGGEFTIVDPPEAFRAHAAVIPERTPQPFQDIARGEALPVALRGYRADARAGHLQVDYEAYDLTIRFDGDFLARHPGAVIEFPHYEWDRSRFREIYAEEPIEGPSLDLRLLPPGTRRLEVRSAKGTLIHSQVMELRRDETIVIR